MVKLFELFYINMTKYDNGEIQLDNRSNYKVGFRFAHFIYEMFIYKMNSSIRIDSKPNYLNL